MGLRLFPEAVLRSAGLPMRLLDDMVDDATVAEVDRDGARAAERAVAHADAALSALCATEAFQRAVALSHPDVLRHAVLSIAEGAGRRHRKRARTATALAQRLTTKNDTANGYGPMDRVALGGEPDLAQPVARADRGAEQAGFVSAWVAERIADAVAADPELAGRLPDRLVAAVEVTEYGLAAGDRRIRLTDAERGAVGQLARGDVGCEPAALDRLRRAGLVVRRLDIRPATVDPLGRLADDLRAVPGGQRWAGELDALRALAQRVADAPWRAQQAFVAELTRRVTALTGSLPERARGRFYTDRDVLYQEGRGAAAAYGVGGRLYERLVAGLEPVARLAAYYGRAQHLDHGDALRAVVGDREIGMVELMARLAAAPGWQHGVPARRAGVLTAQLGERWCRTGRLDRGELDALPGGAALDGVTEPAIFSPDVMLADGPEPGLVIGEVHSGLHTFGLFECFWPDNGSAAWAAGHTRLPDRWAQLVAPRSQGKAFIAELPVRSIEFRARAVRPGAVGLGAVRIRWDGPVPWLLLPGGERRLLVPGDQDNPLCRALSPGLALLPRLGAGDHTPRLSAGDVVVQRERWRVSVPAIERRDPAAQFARVRRWRRAIGLPERVFARPAGAPKPFFVDFRNPLLVDLFLHWAPAGADVELTEALPDRGQLWLRRGPERYTAELRISALWSADS
ncbi:lantibiotic dehydratase [Actinoplanes siamensis]|uniref:Lantibiotic dehydratase n=1 Tax=Actinoplanes siamensis TaxID=1223317 RepID=A0A919TKL0_9ACTN|nr:lantibiotic dehydratase [Actinoplanes siamensis]GIF05438.1 lantibiotic dehydratase [Actinoplanes siamensis]